MTLLVLAAAIALSCAIATGARASAPWGETHHVVLKASREGGHEGIDVGKHIAFASSSTDSSFYVADAVEEGSKPKFRLQRFDAEGKLQGSIEFTTVESSKSQTEGTATELQLAVDPSRNRVYVLAVYPRRPASEKEEGEAEKEELQLEKEGKHCEAHISCYGHFPLDAEEPAAGEIYAFDYTGSGLVSARVNKSTGATVPLANQLVLAAQGENPKEAVLDPRGMAVEPATGDLVIAGQEDEQENIKVEKEVGTRECRAISQIVTLKESSGELIGKLGTRYVDDEEALRPLACELEETESVPYSPFVTTGGKLFAEETRGGEGGEIWQLQQTAEAVPGAKIEVKGEEVPQLKIKPKLVYRLDPKETLLSFGLEGTSGPLMSFVPEGSTAGKIYLMAEVAGQQGEPSNAGILVLSYGEGGSEPELKELGWTAGGYEEGGKREGCVIPRSSAEPVLVGGFKEPGAGGKEGVIAFDAYEHEKIPHADALEFGPGGASGECPKSTVTAPEMRAKGAVVSKPLPGETVTLSSKVEVANVKSVEWQYFNLTTEKAEGSQQGTVEYGPTAVETKVEHAFPEEAEYEATEIVEPDNLASPKIEKKLIVAVKLSKPTFEIEGPERVENGSEASFNAEIRDENKEVTPLKYTWKFGDGSEEKGETASTVIAAKHAYHALCASCEATLEVTDKEGKAGTAKFKLAVVKSKAEVLAEEVLAREAAKKRVEEEEKQKAAEAQRKLEEEEKRKSEEAAKRNPEAKLVGGAATVQANGSFKVQVSCPAGETSCVGTITLRTLGAVSAGPHKKKAVMTLASGRFEVTGGQTRALVLHLSAPARALLAHLHALKGRATLVAHDSAGIQRTTSATLTLHPAKPAHGHKR